MRKEHSSTSYLILFHPFLWIIHVTLQLEGGRGYASRKWLYTCIIELNMPSRYASKLTGCLHIPNFANHEVCFARLCSRIAHCKLGPSQGDSRANDDPDDKLQLTGRF